MARLKIDNGYEPYIFRLHDRKSPVEFRDETLLAIDSQTDRVLAFGSDSRKYISDPSDNICVICPLRNGAPADFDLTATMLKCFMKKAGVPGTFVRPSALVCLPDGITGVERTALHDAFMQAGCGNLMLFEEPFDEAVKKYGDKYRIIVEFEVNKNEA